MTDNEQQPTKPQVQQERLWAMLAHLTAFAGFVFPFGHILGPLVLWLVKKQEFPIVEDQGKESINFQISLTIYGVGAAILTLVGVGLILGIVLLVADVVLVIIAAVRANEGERYRYPATIRFLK